jgi:hypothetical protein
MLQQWAMKKFEFIKGHLRRRVLSVQKTKHPKQTREGPGPLQASMLREIKCAADFGGTTPRKGYMGFILMTHLNFSGTMVRG